MDHDDIRCRGSHVLFDFRCAFQMNSGFKPWQYVGRHFTLWQGWSIARKEGLISRHNSRMQYKKYPSNLSTSKTWQRVRRNLGSNESIGILGKKHRCAGQSKPQDGPWAKLAQEGGSFRRQEDAPLEVESCLILNQNGSNSVTGAIPACMSS